MKSRQRSDRLERFLKAKGCFPAVVGDADAGLKKNKKFEYLKIVLLNVELSGEEDLKVLAQIKKEELDVIVIVIRARGLAARRAMRLGAADALSKRVDLVG